MTAAISGGSPDSLYSSLKSATVVSQPLAFLESRAEEDTRDGEPEKELVNAQREALEQRSD